MNINGVNKGVDTERASPESQVSGKALTQADFMKLFLAQMKTQNPKTNSKRKFVRERRMLIIE